jgi:hypothetical protein
MQMMVGSRRDQQQQQQQGSSADITSLPAPSDSAVRLSVAGGELVAVLPFEGYITPEAAAAARQRLLRALEAGERRLADRYGEGCNSLSYNRTQHGSDCPMQVRGSHIYAQHRCNVWVCRLAQLVEQQVCIAASTHKSDSMCVAVLQYQQTLLCSGLHADGLKLAEAEAGGMFRVAQYGAVHTLEARVNEMMLAVAV